MLRLWRGVAAVWAWLALSLPAAAGAPEGTGWLSSQANANGSLSGATASLATSAPSTAAVAGTSGAFSHVGSP